MLDRDTNYYLILVFIVSYIVEYVIIIEYLSGNFAWTYILLLFLMYIPALCTSIIAVLLRGENLSKYGIDVGSLRLAPLAYIYPLAMILIAAMIMDLLGFPIDWGFAQLKRDLYSAALERNTTPDELAATLIFNSFIAPFFNMIFAVGEEVGWRGYLLDKLMERNSLEKSLLFVGFIWAIWHAPLIIFIGYDYKTLRIRGLLLFIPFCISQGTILAWFKYKSKGIILPALGHGAINAFSFIGNYLYPGDDVLSLVLGIPGVLISSVFGLLAYMNLRKEVFRKNKEEEEQAPDPQSFTPS